MTELHEHHTTNYYMINWPGGNRNKAVYTAALVADGWAGAENLKNNFVTD